MRGAQAAARTARAERSAIRTFMPGTLSRVENRVNTYDRARHQVGIHPPRRRAYIRARMPPTSFESLKRFFESAPAARKATRPLARGARVNLALDGGPAHFTMESGAPQVRTGPAQDPDFTLTLTEGAVSRITGLESEDVGEFGVEFFKLVLERDPALKARVKVEAPTTRLVG